MSDTNGNSESRLDRIERMLEGHSSIMARHDSMMISIDASIISINASIISMNASIDRQVLANEAARERFEAEDKRLLTAQILMNGAMQKMAEGMVLFQSGMVSLELKMEETTGKLNALIETVDGIIGKRPEPEAGQLA